VKSLKRLTPGGGAETLDADGGSDRLFGARLPDPCDPTRAGKARVSGGRWERGPEGVNKRPIGSLLTTSALCSSRGGPLSLTEALIQRHSTAALKRRRRTNSKPSLLETSVGIAGPQHHAQPHIGPRRRHRTSRLPVATGGARTQRSHQPPRSPAIRGYNSPQPTHTLTLRELEN